MPRTSPSRPGRTGARESGSTVKTFLRKSSAPRSQRFLWILGAFALAGFLLRVFVSWEILRADPAAFQPGAETDMATYLELSSRMLSGAFRGAFYYQPFYYAVFLPLVRIVFFFCPAVWAAALAQSVCGAGIIWFSGLSAALLRGRTAGLIAGFLAAFSTLLVFYTSYALLEVQNAFWIVLLLYLLIRFHHARKLRFLCGAGFVFSFAVLSRGNAWFFLPGILYLIWKTRPETLCGETGNIQSRARAFSRKTLLFLLCAILPQLPFAIHNSLEEKMFCGPSTAGAPVLALGNNPESPPGSLPRPYPETYRVWTAQAASGGPSLWTRILRWAVSEPAAFLELQFRKILLFWDSREIPNNVSLSHNGKFSGALNFAFLRTSLILVLALAAFLLDWKRIFGVSPCSGKASGRFLLLFSAGGILGVSAFYLLARFRVPLLGVLCVPASFAPGSARRVLRSGRGKALFPLAAFFFSLFVVFTSYGTYQFFLEKHVMRLVRPHGVELEVSETEREVLDHGPVFFENRGMMELLPGSVIEKSFSPADPARDREKICTLELTLFAEEKDELTLEINGRECVIRTDSPVRGGLPLYKAKTPLLPCPRNLAFRIRVLSSRTSRTVLLTDVTRDYGRTRWNGEGYRGEACIRAALSGENAGTAGVEVR